jgi:hypothetical protein
MQGKISLGGFVAESDNFAAVACWEPPEVSEADADEIWGDMDVATRVPDAERRPIFMNFLKQVAETKRKTFPRGQRYWHLTLMARDPDRRDKGSVRAVMEPFLQRARQEGLPIWLEAGNERARDVYAWVGGFKVASVVWHGIGEFDGRGRRKEGGDGVATYLMVANWPVEPVAQ